MSDFPLTFVLQIKTSKIINDVAKVQQKSEKITVFGGIFSSSAMSTSYGDWVLMSFMSSRNWDVKSVAVRHFREQALPCANNRNVYIISVLKYMLTVCFLLTRF